MLSGQKERPIYSFARLIDEEIDSACNGATKRGAPDTKKQKKKDRKIICCDRQTPFLFTGGEQRYFETHNLIEPKRCRACRKKRKMLFAEIKKIMEEK